MPIKHLETTVQQDDGQNLRGIEPSVMKLNAVDYQNVRNDVSFYGN